MTKLAPRATKTNATFRMDCALSITIATRRRASVSRWSVSRATSRSRRFRPETGERPAYFILLDWEGAWVSAIRDFRYVPYIALEAEYELLRPLA